MDDGTRSGVRCATNAITEQHLIGGYGLVSYEWQTGFELTAA